MPQQGPLLSFCPGVPWERRYRWEKITREPLINWLELLVPVEIRKRGKAFNDCYLRFQLKVITWPQSLDNTAIIVHFKKKTNPKIQQFLNFQLSLLFGWIILFLLSSLQCGTLNLRKKFAVLVMVQCETFSNVPFTGVNF